MVAQPTAAPAPKLRRTSERVRVAMVGPSVRYIGGQSAQLDLLLRYWRDDPAVRATFLPVDPTLPRWIAWVERIPLLRTLVRAPFYLAGLWRGIADADIVHIFSASYWSFLLAPAPAWLVARLRGKRALVHYHSGEARDHLRRSRTAVALLRRADGIVAPSAYLAGVFREFGIQSTIIPNVIDEHRFSYRERRPLRPWLVCTRGFDPYYSVDLVVRAFAEVKKQFPEARLCLAGAGRLEQAIRAMARDLQLPDVEFAGAVGRDQIGRLYDRADIFVNASWLDNMPVSILEAWACGTPVVSTAPEGIRHLVAQGHNGLLCDPGDWQALAANVIRLLRDPDFALRLARNAYEDCRRYRWNQVREEWLRTYRSLLDTQAAAPAAV